jgi:hypothetical protein
MFENWLLIGLLFFWFCLTGNCVQERFGVNYKDSRTTIIIIIIIIIATLVVVCSIFKIQRLV